MCTTPKYHAFSIDPPTLLFSSSQDLKHVFPASRLLISTVTTELQDLSKGYATFKRLVEGDPNLRPNPPAASPVSSRGGNPPPSPGSASLKRSASLASSVGGGESDGGANTDGSSPGTRSGKLMSLSRQKTENRKSMANTGKVSYATYIRMEYIYTSYNLFFAFCGCREAGRKGRWREVWDFWDFLRTMPLLVFFSILDVYPCISSSHNLASHNGPMKLRLLLLCLREFRWLIFACFILPLMIEMVNIMCSAQ